MFEQVKAYKEMITAIIIIIVSIVGYIYISSLKSQITTLRGDLKDSQVELANYKLESTRCKNSLENQNESIESLKANEALNLAKLKKWKEKPTNDRYKVIRKIVEVESNECKDIKNVLNAVPTIDYNSL